MIVTLAFSYFQSPFSKLLMLLTPQTTLLLYLVNIPSMPLTFLEVGLRLAVGWCKPWLLSVWLAVCQTDEPISVIYPPQQSFSDNLFIFLLTVMPTVLLFILCVGKRRPPLEIFPCSSKGLGQSSSGVETAFGKLFTRMSTPREVKLCFYSLPYRWNLEQCPVYSRWVLNSCCLIDALFNRLWGKHC